PESPLAIHVNCTSWLLAQPSSRFVMAYPASCRGTSSARTLASTGTDASVKISTHSPGPHAITVMSDTPPMGPNTFGTNDARPSSVRHVIHDLPRRPSMVSVPPGGM